MSKPTQRDIDRWFTEWSSVNPQWEYSTLYIACKAYEAGVATERERAAKIVENYCGAWDDQGFALSSSIRSGK